VCLIYFLVGDGVCIRSIGVQVIAEKTKIHSYLQVAKNAYPQDVSDWPNKLECLNSRTF
jgi:hypothetical protein